MEVDAETPGSPANSTEPKPSEEAFAMMSVGFDLGNLMSKVCQLNPKVCECARLAHCSLLVVVETTSVYLLH